MKQIIIAATLILIGMNAYAATETQKWALWTYIEEDNYWGRSPQEYPDLASCERAAHSLTDEQPFVCSNET